MTDDATPHLKGSVRGALILAGVQVGGALLLTLAHKPLGWIDGETATRGVMVLIGLMLVVIGNAMPKKQEGPPSQTVDEIGLAQHGEVGRHGRTRDREMVGELPRRHRPLLQQLEHLAARGIGQGFEDGVHELIFS